MRAEIERLLTEVPFRPFVITLENRQRAAVEHPENVVFDYGDNGRPGSEDFYMRSGTQRLYSTFDAVTSLTQQGQEH